MFDALGSRLRASLQRLGGRGRISEADLEAGLAEIRTALIDADVALSVTDSLIASMRTHAHDEKVVGGIGSGDRLVAIVHAALTEALGGSGRELDLRERTASILLLGLQGAGKTTTAAKLALRLLRDGRRPLLVAADPRRPAAAEQLALLGAAIGVPVHREAIGTPVAEIGRRALESAKKLGRDLLIIDSSGRTTLDEELMRELADLRAAVNPRERILVLDAATGQQALRVAEGFKEAADPPASSWRSSMATLVAVQPSRLREVLASPSFISGPVSALKPLSASIPIASLAASSRWEISQRLQRSCAMLAVIHAHPLQQRAGVAHRRAR